MHKAPVRRIIPQKPPRVHTAAFPWERGLPAREWEVPRLSLGARASSPRKTIPPRLSLGARASRPRKTIPPRLSLGARASSPRKTIPPRFSLGARASSPRKTIPPRISLGARASSPRKKNTTLAPVALPAWAAEVYSSNIVGYQKITLQPGFNLIASQFNLVGGETKTIQELIEAANSLPGLDGEGDFQTTMRIWNGTGYSTYGWLDADDGSENEMPEWNSKWLLGDMSDLAATEVAPGMGCWIITPTATSITFDGEVPASSSTAVAINNNFNLVANPLPTAINIQNIQPSGSLLGLDGEGEFQTTMRVWNGTGYSTYGWLDADDGTENEMPEWNSKWLLGDMSDLANVTIAAGQGFWIISPKATGSVTFVQ